MVEPVAIFGAVANAVAFVGILARLTSRMKHYCSAAQDPPGMFKTLVNQLDALLDLCAQFQKITAPDISRNLDRVLVDCTEQVLSLEAIVIKVLPGDNDSISSKAMKAIKSVHFEKKVAGYVSVLETIKTLLTFHLTMSTFMVVQSNRPATTARDTCFYFPSTQRTRFIPREAILTKIDAQLKSPQSDPRVVVLLGMGGQGKTSLALEYCKRESVAGYYKAIIWINATSLATLQSSFASVAEHLTQHRGHFSNPNACVEFVKATIESWSTPWLVVFDNYNQLKKLNKIMSFIPKSTKGSVLFTSRHADCEALGSVIPVRGMSDIEGLALLMERTKIAPSYETIQQGLRVVHTLGSLPLAIDQCAAYIRSRRIKMKDFIDHYQNRKEKVLRHVPTIWDYQQVLEGSQTLDGTEVNNEAPISVFATWEMSFQQAVLDDEYDPASVQHFLTVAGFFNNLDIRMEMFQAFYERIDEPPGWMRIFAGSKNAWNQYAYQDVASNLSRLSLLQLHESHDDCGDWEQREESFCCFSIHPLVRDWIQLRLSSAERRQYIIETVAILKSYIESGGQDSDDWPLQVKREVLLHLEACLESQMTNLEDWAATCYDKLHDGLLEFCIFFKCQGRYAEAESLCEKILDADREVSGTDSEATWMTSMLIADIYLARGRYLEAESALHDTVQNPEALERSKKIHYLKSLARTHFCRGRYPEADKLYHDALEEQSSSLSPTDPKRLDTIWSIAQIYRNQGQFTEATRLYNEVLAGYKTKCNDHHPAALRCMVDLANNYRAQGLYKDASALYLLAFDGNKHHLGKNHPHTIASQLFLAINYRDLFQYEEANAHLREVIAQSEKILGAKHPDTLKAVMNYAISCDRQGQVTQAEKLYTRALEGRVAILGTGSPYTMRTLERLVNLLLVHGRADEGDTLIRKTLNGFQRDNGLVTLEGTRPHQAAEELFERALLRDVSFLGPAQNDRIGTQKSLAQVYILQGRLDAARLLLGKVKEAMEERFGRQHDVVVECTQTLEKLDVGSQSSQPERVLQ
ncbi:hypothetical protein N7492_000460 [Penicillium capsulatum]|uniref:NB-ARC domain-containing protein n=1 Tax=Penicillium capsulatum TaxID=69766 RepID=A0A9W9LZF1_9EURO|nr:hypothetical protein N7492_000460 [Penicillium capsulatum]KAJ6130480.1 hypothetical protein N7512_003260 [Penicillium capsulatum]